MIIKLDDKEAQMKLLSRQSEYNSGKVNLRKAEIKKEKTEIDFKRHKSMHDRQLVSKSDLENAEYDLEILKNDYESLKSQQEDLRSAVEMARIELERTKIVAPFDGIIASIEIKEFENIAPGRTVCRLIDDSELIVKASVDEVDALSMEPGQKAKILIDALPDEEFSGILTRISPIVTSQGEQNRTVGIWVKFAKTSPNIKGFDISGTCLPAKEVGGDYFDFVKLGSSKLGIAVGDVSGKGVPAAIYMTLTKGILQSHAEENISPKLVLNKVNKLLYRTIEKNSFVSMFYAILDTDSKQLTYARAGHNPGIIVSQSDGDSTLLTAEGIALGLEEGTVFDKTLEENTINVKSGDTLIFYTDGIVEAMNEKLNEFGEDNFLDLVSKNNNLTSSQMIDLILKEVKDFTSNFPQNDDITIVVIKVL